MSLIKMLRGKKKTTKKNKGRTKPNQQTRMDRVAVVGSVLLLLLPEWILTSGFVPGNLEKESVAGGAVTANQLSHSVRTGPVKIIKFAFLPLHLCPPHVILSLQLHVRIRSE